MKKLTFLAGAALVCALVCPGCSGDGFDEMNGTPDAGNPDTPAAEGGIRTLTVGMAQFGAPGTRASFGDESDGKLPVFWEESDRIVAYETVGEHTVGHAYRLVGAGGSASGTFTYDGGADGSGVHCRDLLSRGAGCGRIRRACGADLHARQF